jgi:hypothetical protein
MAASKRDSARGSMKVIVFPTANALTHTKNRKVICAECLAENTKGRKCDIQVWQVCHRRGGVGEKELHG